MNRVNYDREMQALCAREKGKRLLLHVCCAPCSTYPLTILSDVFRTTALFYNPNLDGGEEYEKRRAEEERFLKETGFADLLEFGYDHDEFLKIAEGLEDVREGGARCMKCFALRLEKTARIAKERGYDLFGTTLTLSPLKDAEAINAIGRSVAEKVGVAYLPSDFKKRGGYLRSVGLSKEYGLYRQNYCGCEFSKRDAIRSRP